MLKPLATSQQGCARPRTLLGECHKAAQYAASEGSWGCSCLRLRGERHLDSIASDLLALLPHRAAQGPAEQSGAPQGGGAGQGAGP